MVKILQVIYYDPANYPPTLNAMRVLARAGAEVSCLGFYRGKSYVPELPASARIEYLNEPPGGWKNTFSGLVLEPLAFRRSVERAVERLRPDFVLAYDHWGMWASARIVRRVPVVYHIHDTVEPSDFSPFGRQRYITVETERAARHCVAVVLPDEGRAELFASRVPQTARIHVVANAPPRRSPAKGGGLRPLMAAADGSIPERIAVLVGNMGSARESVRALARAAERWHYAVVGSTDRRGLEAMREEAEAGGFSDRLRIFPYRPYDEIAPLLAGADLGFGFYSQVGRHSSNWRLMGTGSVKVMEYLASGVPAIVSPRSAFARFGATTEGLRIVDEETAEEFRKAIDELDPSGPEWARRSRAASRDHLRLYNLETQMAPLLDLFGLPRFPPVDLSAAG